MEFREIIVWFGLVAILIILWDGFRRMKSKPKKPKFKAEPEDDWEDPEEAARKAQIARELPNGGARIREMTEEEKKKISTKFNLNLRERVPMLMERVVVEGEESDAERLEKEAADSSNTDSEAAEVHQSEMDFTTAEVEPTEATASEIEDDLPASEQEADIEPIFGALDNEPLATDDDAPFNADQSDLEQSSKEAPVEDEPDEASTDDFEDDYDSEDPEENKAAVDQETDESGTSLTTEETTKPEVVEPLPVEDLIVVHLMAKEGGEINGRALLELLVHAGLRHGPMDIFHYRNPQGKTEFSLANCVRPGTFNPDAMADVNTPGVTLFLQLPCTADAMESFEHMIEMARFMASNLNADLLDEEHSTVTPQVVEYYREKLRAFARKQLIPS